MFCHKLYCVLVLRMYALENAFKLPQPAVQCVMIEAILLLLTWCVSNTYYITYISAACAFNTRDQPLSSPKQLSAQTRSHSQIQDTSTTYLSSAGSRSRLPFEDVLRHTLQHCVHV